MKLCYTLFHCSFECWRCTLLWCVKWGHLNSLSFTTKLKLLHSLARFCSIFPNDGLVLSFVCMCQCVNSCMCVCVWMCVSVFLNNDRLWLHRGV